MRPDWFPDWSGETVGIVASGQSVTQENVDLLRGRCRVVVVNNNHELAPWADLLYAADEKWWEMYPTWRQFVGLKVTASAKAAAAHKLKLVLLADPEGYEESSRITMKEFGAVSRGGNSAFQAVNLACQFGATRMIWLGFDFFGTHWHENHPGRTGRPYPATLRRWAKTLDAQADILRSLNVDVANCSENSALKAYTKMSVAEALERWTSNDRRVVAA